MEFLSHLLRVGYFFVLIELINSYLLIAANLNDFRTIAKKLVPDDFANKITKVVSDPAFEKIAESSYDNSDYEEIDKSHPNLKVKAYDKPKEIYDIQGTKINFEELVDRVKKRLERELQNKYIVKKQNDNLESRTDIKQKEYAISTKKKSDRIIINNYNKLSSRLPDVEETGPVYDNVDYEEAVTNTKYIEKEIKFTTKDDRYEYADALADVKAVKENRFHNNDRKKRTKTKKVDRIYNDYESSKQNNMYKKIHMSKKDSYEDYKIPEKESVYSSQERQDKKRFKIEERRRSTKKFKNAGYKKIVVSQDKKSEEVAGVTEDLLDEYNDTEIISDVRTRDRHDKGIDKKLVTMMPKRERYTIVTPNYIKNIPNVAEKYNFNEPIPDRDREREVLKYYGNPPARINKKIRLL